LGADPCLHFREWCKARGLRQHLDRYRRANDVPDGAREPGRGDIRIPERGGASLAEGTKLTISIPAEESPQALYTFALGDVLNPLTPPRLILVGGPRPPFVNTSLRFLNGFDYLFDADGGFAGFRWTGHAAQNFGKAAPRAPAD
jgi:hypothetical protein